MDDVAPMELLTPELREQLLANGQAQKRVAGTADEIDFYPVVKLFTPDAGATWLLTELDPDRPDVAFGLCDLGLGCTELGRVKLSEIAKVRGAIGLPVERDILFKAKKPLSAYTEEASRTGRIKT